MTGLPVLSGDAAIRSFEKPGYQVVRQNGSHVRMVRPDQSKKPLTIPRHDVLGKGFFESF
ncbi:type II toxin-antitoxin system HicA family toxin [Methanofollis ethanolicus]|uniref:type II toxin-antitoxin system HicA family toxin n=1 Tax=Methanofollis ethanolicus TaxID=488124 RepID=UPI00191C0643|nr:type II toxin-antitoxin system HicA family toxin [Methanofollis ethanolicus]